jgi:hypothetical protein
MSSIRGIIESGFHSVRCVTDQGVSLSWGCHEVRVSLGREYHCVGCVMILGMSLIWNAIELGMSWNQE